MACTPPPSGPDGGLPLGPNCQTANITREEPITGIAGVPLTVDANLALTCPTVNVRATVELVGPDNLPLAFDAGTAVTLDAVGYHDSITFTPNQPGRYHLVVHFEPSVGIVQLDLRAAENRLDAGAAYDLADGSLVMGCSQLDVTQHSQLLCLAPFGLFTADGMPTDNPDAGDRVDAAAYVDGVLWLQADTRVSRWREEATGFVLTHAIDIPSLGEPQLLQATADDVVVVDPGNGRGHWVTATDAGLQATTQWLNDAGSVTALWRQGDEVMSVGVRGACFGWRDGGTGPCTGASPSAVAVDGDGVWTRTQIEDFNTLISVPQLELVRPHSLVDLALPHEALIRPMGMTAMGFADTSPWMVRDDANLVLSYGNEDVQLTAYPPGELTSVTGRWVTLRTTTGVRLYAR